MRSLLLVCDSRATWSRALTVCEAAQDRDDLTLLLVLLGPLAVADRHDSLLDGIPVGARLGLHPGWRLSMAEQTGHYIAELAEFISARRPDVVVSMTDRHESLAAAVAGALSGRHVAHIQGGEVSGSLDESMRHAISKLAHIHFPANADSAQRIERLGEDPKHIHTVGCPATDLLLRVDVGAPLPNPGRHLLVSYNPVTTLPAERNYVHMRAILEACQERQRGGLPLLVVGPNHDQGEDAVWKAIRDAGAAAEPSLPHSQFIRLMANAAVMVGNSSAGIREACYWGTPVVNVGTRQQSRAVSQNVLTVTARPEAIKDAIALQLAHGRYEPEQPFGDGGAGPRIAEILATAPLPPLQKHLRY